MVIDRTTGKGCALSIAAKTVTRNLIADGIIGKTIAKKERPKRSVWLRVRDYGDDWVCIGGNIAHELTEEPLWVPSFIDERIWTQAVSKFHIDSRLDENVVEFLLPEMDEYLQNIPDSELISITRDFRDYLNIITLEEIQVFRRVLVNMPVIFEISLILYMINLVKCQYMHVSIHQRLGLLRKSIVFVRK